MTHIIVDEKLKKKMHYPVGLHLPTNSILIKHYISIIKQELIKENIEPYEVALICMGSSGAIIAGIIGYQLGLKVYHVKKEGEYSHYVDTPSIKEKITIVVDDYISTGNTINTICNRYQHLYMLILTHKIWEELSFINKFQKIYVGEYKAANSYVEGRTISYERSTAETL